MKRVELEEPIAVTEPPVHARRIQEVTVPDPTDVPSTPAPAKASKESPLDPAKLLAKWTSRSLIAWVGACALLVHGNIGSQEWMWVTIAMIGGTKALDAVEAYTKR